MQVRQNHAFIDEAAFQVWQSVYGELFLFFLGLGFEKGLLLLLFLALLLSYVVVALLSEVFMDLLEVGIEG